MGHYLLNYNKADLAGAMFLINGPPLSGKAHGPLTFTATLQGFIMIPLGLSHLGHPYDFNLISPSQKGIDNVRWDLP